MEKNLKINMGLDIENAIPYNELLPAVGLLIHHIPAPEQLTQPSCVTFDETLHWLDGDLWLPV